MRVNGVADRVTIIHKQKLISRKQYMLAI